MLESVASGVITQHVISLDADKRKNGKESFADNGSRGEAVCRHWYVAVVKNTREKYRADMLRMHGYECYVPVQTVFRQHADGRRMSVERVVIPARVFVRVTETERLRILKSNLVLRFMSDISCGSGRSKVAVVPDIQMKMLKFMLFNADRPVTIGSAPVHRGDRVRVTRGRLQGLEGNVVYEPDGRTTIYVSLDVLGTAKVEIDRESIETVALEF